MASDLAVSPEDDFTLRSTPYSRQTFLTATEPAEHKTKEKPNYIFCSENTNFGFWNLQVLVK